MTTTIHSNEARSISAEEARRMIEQIQHGRIFRVDFVRRTDGRLRRMICRRGVLRGINGQGQRYDPQQHDLVCVYDMARRGFRMIPLDAILGIKMFGVEYQVAA